MEYNPGTLIYFEPFKNSVSSPYPLICLIIERDESAGVYFVYDYIIDMTAHYGIIWVDKHWTAVSTIFEEAFDN